MNTPQRPNEPVRGVGSNQHADKPPETSTVSADTVAAGKSVGAAADTDPFLDPRDQNNPAYEDPLNPGLLIRDYCSCEGPDHDYDCELDEDNW